MSIEISTAVLIYLATLNVLTFVLYGIDKYKARHDRWRISEATLLGLSVLGGAIGAWLGIRIWHHKTQHAIFRYGVPLILLAQLAVVAFLIYSR